MNNSPTHPITAQNCPACGESLTVSWGAWHDGVPETGVPTICTFCAAFLLFDKEMRLHVPDPMERLALELHKDWPAYEYAQRIVRAWLDAIRELQAQGLSREEACALLDNAAETSSP